MHCSNCGTENPETATFCQQCGQQISVPTGGTAAISGFAITSLVLGIFGFLVSWFTLLIPSILTVIFGHIARGKISRSNGAVTGGGMALTGLIFGYIQLSMIPIGIIAALAVPAYQDYTLRSRISEATVLSAAPRTAIDVAVSEGFRLGEIPMQPEKIGLAKAQSYQSRYVESVSYDANGIVTVRFKNNKTLFSAAGKVIIFAPQADGKNLIWSVHKDSTVRRRYWPRL